MREFIARSRAKRWCRLSVQALAISMLAIANGYAQAPPGTGEVSIPGSSVEKPGDTGVRPHTNIQILIPDRAANGTQSPPGGGGHAATGSHALQVPEANRTNAAPQ